jgi:hypothetical protein
MNIAYSERNIKQIKKLTQFNFFYKVLKTLLKKIYFSGNKEIKKVQIFPAIISKEHLSDIINRLSWGVPANCKITITVSDALSDVKISELQPPASQKKYIGTTQNIKITNSSAIKKADALLVHNFNIKRILQLLFKLNQTEIIDAHYFSATESMVWQYFYYQTFSNKEKVEFQKLSEQNFCSMKHINSGKKKAYCFVTGPSFDSYKQYDFEKNTFKIICNSIVKNTTFLDYIEKPDLLVFADPVFHYSPCLYSATFRDYMLNVVEKYDCFVATNSESVPLLLFHYPQLKNRIIGIEKAKRNPLNFPSAESLFVKSTHNILTLFMLPIASSISNEVIVLGADGRKSDEKYFWKHSSSVQLDDLMQTAFDTHPSFFRDRDYADYYSEHCAYLEKLITFGEKQGKKYYSLSDSYIPAFAKRKLKL